MIDPLKVIVSAGDVDDPGPRPDYADNYGAGIDVDVGEPIYGGPRIWWSRIMCYGTSMGDAQNMRQFVMDAINEKIAKDRGIDPMDGWAAESRSAIATLKHLGYVYKNTGWVPRTCLPHVCGVRVEGYNVVMSIKGSLANRNTHARQTCADLVKMIQRV